MFRKTTDESRRLELTRAQLHVMTAIAGRLSETAEAQAEALEVLIEQDAELTLENQGLNVELELREQQLASIMDMVAERNRYTEHVGSMDVSRVTDPEAVLEALVREARELTHEYATASAVVQDELEYSGR